MCIRECFDYKPLIRIKWKLKGWGNYEKNGVRQCEPP